jgi:para-aminobenzoate synthetase/4-amino-4-deoxychorismate lyase
VVRVSVARDGATRAFVLDADVVARWEPGTGPIVRLAFADDPVPSFNVFLFHQTSRHQVYEDRARASLAVDADDIIFINERDEVTQATTANVAALIGGRWCTPPIESGCLAGVYRASLIEAEMLSERPITIAEFTASEEIALLSSIRGWQRAQLVTE